MTAAIISFEQYFLFLIAFILPAWVANATPVLFGGKTPLDLNKRFMGKPILGKHKTVRGTISGLVAGFAMSAIESYFLPFMLVTGIALTLGAIFGDLLGSFIKRRMGRKEGHGMILMDQYLFFVFALLFASPFFLPAWLGILILAILTGILHKALNVLAYVVKIKPVPW